MFSFRILKKDKRSRARLGVLKTPHGIIRTPGFVPVATKGALRGIAFDSVAAMPADIFMVNTFHFYIHDRYKLVKKFGGLHKFMNVRYPLMTDSGGFQVFSLGFGMEHGVGKIASIFPHESLREEQLKQPIPAHRKLFTVADGGAIFHSPKDGKTLKLDPEISIRVQQALGADIIFSFDECTSPLAGYEYTKRALTRTHAWAGRSLKAFIKIKTSQVMFGIVQGGEYKDLRKESAGVIGDMPFFGFGIGGSLGKSKKDMHKVLEWVIPHLPQTKPRHLLGIGEPEDLFEGVERGVDLFDCVIPTRLARHGTAFVRSGNINLKASRYSGSKQPIDPSCGCRVCRLHTRAYLTHLFKEKELYGIMLLTEHNLFWILSLMSRIRQAIRSGDLPRLKRAYLRS